MVRRYDTDYEAYRRDVLHRFRNMDPDELVCELGVDTDVLIGSLLPFIDQYIEETYNGDQEKDEQDGFGIEEAIYDPFG